MDMSRWSKIPVPSIISKLKGLLKALKVLEAADQLPKSSAVHWRKY
jgi:hypothetical protein